MSRRRKPHYPLLPAWLNQYAHDNGLEFAMYSPYHMRLMDGGFTTLDVWLTGRYYVMSTDYRAAYGPQLGLVERAGEKGQLPVKSEQKLTDWLDRLFFMGDYL